MKKRMGSIVNGRENKILQGGNRVVIISLQFETVQVSGTGVCTFKKKKPYVLPHTHARTVCVTCPLGVLLSFSPSSPFSYAFFV